MVECDAASEAIYAMALEYGGDTLPNRCRVWSQMSNGRFLLVQRRAPEAASGAAASCRAMGFLAYQHYKLASEEGAARSHCYVLYVKPEHRRRGVARRMLRRFTEPTDASLWSRVQLTVTRSNAAAVALYELARTRTG